MFRDFHLVTEDYSVRLQLGYAIFRWWRPLTDKEITDGIFIFFSNSTYFVKIVQDLEIHLCTVLLCFVTWATVQPLCILTILVVEVRHIIWAYLQFSSLNSPSQLAIFTNFVTGERPLTI